ncbi:MAG: hypothetical protein HOV94_41370 [Saccharothrix sp.]|nr:hypothetical protein [Saccharothrix sp.]
MTHPPRPTTMISHADPTPQRCWATACGGPARAQDEHVIPKYCSDACARRTVAERQLVIDGDPRPAVHLHPGPLRVERPTAPTTQVVYTSTTPDTPFGGRSVNELIVDAYVNASARLWSLVFGRGGR